MDRQPFAGPPPTGPQPGDADFNGATYYRTLHDLAARTACREARVLPSTTYTPDNPATVGMDEESCRSADEAAKPLAPVIMSCICTMGWIPTAATSRSVCRFRPTAASSRAPRPRPGRNGGRRGEPVRRRRVCYQFTTIVNLQDLQLPLGWGLSLGDIWVERANTFTVGFYPPPPTPTPPPPPPPPSPEPCSPPVASFTAAPLSGTSPLGVVHRDGHPGGLPDHLVELELRRWVTLVDGGGSGAHIHVCRSRPDRALHRDAHGRQRGRVHQATQVITVGS